MPTNFTKAEYQSIMSKVNPNLYGKLRELFIVLNDDLEKINTRGKATSTPAAEPESQVAPEPQSDEPRVVFTSPPLTGANLSESDGRGRGSKRPSKSPANGQQKRAQHNS